MLKLIVFDWDGTLSNSIDQIIKCKQFLAKKYSLPVPEKELIKSVIGINFKDAMEACFPTASYACLEKLSFDFHVNIQKEQFFSELIPSSTSVLNQLKKNNYKLAIASSKNKAELVKELIRHDIYDVFDKTCCGHEYENKPSASMLLYLMGYFNVKNNEVIMVGDTTTDLVFAHNAGVSSVAVASGAHSKSALLTLKPDFIIDNIAELPSIVNNRC